MGNQQAQVQEFLDGAREAHSRFDGAKIFWKPQRQRDADCRNHLQRQISCRL